MKKQYDAPALDFIRLQISEKLMETSDVPENMIPDQYYDQYLDNPDFTMPKDW